MMTTEAQTSVATLKTSWNNYKKLIKEKQDDTINPLYEPTELAEDEVTTLNELHCVGFSPDFDDEVVWHTNALREDDKDEVMQSMKTTTLVSSMLSDLTFDNPEQKSTTGSHIVDFVLANSNTYFTLSDALTYAEEYLFQHLVPVPYHVSTVTEFSTNVEYRLLSNDEPKYYSGQILNVPPKSSYREVKLQNFDVVRNLEQIVSKICTEFVDYKNRTVDYTTFSRSPMYQMIQVSVGYLRTLDVGQLSEEDKTILFILAHNVMVIQATIIRGCDEDAESRQRFLNQDMYFIGSYKYSPNDLRYLLLGQPQQIPEYKHYLRQYAIREPNIKIALALCNGCTKDPLPFGITKDKFKETLDVIASDFITHDCEPDDASNQLVVHDLFYKYKHLLKVDLVDLVLEHNTSRQSREKIKRMKDGEKPIGIDYRDSVYTTNRPFVADSQIRMSEANIRTLSVTGVDQRIFDALLDLQDILQNDCYRDYFSQFAKMEYSIENVLFYEQCMEYRKAPPSSYASIARNIYDTFLRPDSQFEINVVSTAITAVCDKLFTQEDKKQGMQELQTRKHRKSIAVHNLTYDQLLSTMNTPTQLKPLDTSETLSIDLFEELEVMAEQSLSDTYSRFVLSEIYKTMISDVQQFLDTFKGLRKIGSTTRLLSAPQTPRGTSPAHSPRSPGHTQVSNNTIDARLAQEKHNS